MSGLARPKFRPRERIANAHEVRVSITQFDRALHKIRTRRFETAKAAASACRVPAAA
jgi:hypothetical protein